MLKLSRRTVVATGLVAAIAAAVPATLAATTSSAQPANKAVAAGSHRVQSAPGQKLSLMSTTFKTSKPEDLLMTVSLECSILTALTTDNDNPSADAQSTARIWIEIDGKIVPIEDVSAPPQNPGAAGSDADKITFCNREYSRTVTDDETPADGIDSDSDFIKTKSAHSFSWVALNAGSGTHTAVVYAELTTSATQSAQATLDIGNRTFIVEPTKLANNAVISEAGTG